MHHRRDFLGRTLGGSALLAAGPVVPEFLARAAAQPRPRTRTPSSSWSSWPAGTTG
ncbi:hypothetical protein [Urbifossiella limnaea]|uniref:hypothetical protein n=1 Tax=Urbifossiella limnaea TaxID=2528023 RepID=UPI00192E5A63|nr:hypothetical protein [Urbifossiella limnaea]